MKYLFMLFTLAVLTTQVIAQRVPNADIHAPIVVSQVEPVYTEEARKANISGIVILKCLIQEDGNITDIIVLTSLPFGLDQAAINAAKAWKFKPGTFKGKSVPVVYIITINFKLNIKASR